MLCADLDLDRLLAIKPVRPGEAPDSLLDVFLVLVRAGRDAPQHATGDPAAQVDRITKLERAGESDSAVGGGNVGGAQLLQFGGEHAFQPTGAGRKEGLVFITHTCSQ
jgi:hypothetical protein